MVRKLLTVPMIHKFPESLKFTQEYLQDEQDDSLSDFFEKREKLVDKSVKRLAETVTERLKEYNVDVIFLEGMRDEESVEYMNKEDFEPVSYSKELTKILKFLREGGARFEKTEDYDAYEFCHDAFEESMSHLLPNSELSRQLLKVSVDYRDDYMGRNISDRLRDGETGIVFYGARHNPGEYAKRYGRDITIIPLYQKDTLEKELGEFLKEYLSPSVDIPSLKLFE